MRQVALLGAPATGKTQLAAALLAARPDLFVTVIDGCPVLACHASHGLKSPQLSFFDLNLLMGLDLPQPAGGSSDQETADGSLRRTLAQAGISYKVIYGQGPERLLNALRALDALASCNTQAAGIKRSPWVWSCDTCSDPLCERRLLSDLLAKRVR